GRVLPTANSSLVGNIGAEIGANFMAHATLGVRSYSLSSFSPAGADDFAASASTTGVVLVNDTAEGELEKNGDRDWFKADLAGGRSYLIDVRGADTDDGTLVDPYLRIHTNKVLGEVDDGGVHWNSR